MILTRHTRRHSLQMGNVSHMPKTMLMLLQSYDGIVLDCYGGVATIVSVFFVLV